MSYIPKSKYQIRETSGNEFISTVTKAHYIGTYVTTGDKAYEGVDVTKLGPILIPIKNKPSKINNILEHETTNNYYLANPAIVNRVKKHKPLVSTKNKPTKKDYKIGYYIRYFCKRNNSDNVYYEITKKQYKGLIGKSKSYDYNLYSPGSIKWAIDGDIIKINTNALKRKERIFPNLSNLFPKLNEYQLLRYTTGKELIYLNGEEYIGYYHIHPIKGPMEGKYHSSLPHKELKFMNQNTLSKNLSNQKGPRISKELEPYMVPPVHDHNHDEEMGEKSGY